MTRASSIFVAILLLFLLGFKPHPVLFEIFYDKNGDVELSQQGKNRLDTTILPVLMENRDARLMIYGHSNSEESTEEDTLLSFQRAVIAKKYLVSQGVDSSYIKCRGMGRKMPHTFAEDGNLLRHNRRVEFALYQVILDKNKKTD